MTPFIDLIAGARPNFVKIAAIVRAIHAIPEPQRLRYRLVHTGQHYDPRLSDDFFVQLEIPRPDVHLEVRAGSPSAQTAAIMAAYEQALTARRPALTIVVGDVNSTVACAIAAQQAGVPVAHVEGGIRSGDWSMPEEINRRATDAISDWFFTTSEYANAELRRSGVSDDRIFFVGNTMIDTLRWAMNRLRPSCVADELRSAGRRYLVLTLHRPANVDDPARLLSILQSIGEGAGEDVVVFPVHPRTRARLAGFADALPPSIRTCDSMPYLEFIDLVRDAAGVITDSGGITEETTVLGIPCITLRDSTERPETVLLGSNELVGTRHARVVDALRRLRSGDWKPGEVPPLWDGGAATRIVARTMALLASGTRPQMPAGPADTARR